VLGLESGPVQSFVFDGLHRCCPQRIN
jgi:hypothetical protein